MVWSILRDIPSSSIIECVYTTSAGGAEPARQVVFEGASDGRGTSQCVATRSPRVVVVSVTSAEGPYDKAQTMSTKYATQSVATRAPFKPIMPLTMVPAPVGE